MNKKTAEDVISFRHSCAERNVYGFGRRPLCLKESWILKFVIGKFGIFLLFFFEQ